MFVTMLVRAGLYEFSANRFDMLVDEGNMMGCVMEVQRQLRNGFHEIINHRLLHAAGSCETIQLRVNNKMH